MVIDCNIDLIYKKKKNLTAGICFGWENFGRHEGEAMGRQTDLVLDASLPKHKN